MLKQILCAVFILSLGFSATARNKKLSENRVTNKKGVTKIVQKINDFLAEKGIQETIEVGSIDMKNAGTFLNALRGLREAIETKAKNDPLGFESLKAEGQFAQAIRSANEVAQNAHKFEAAKKEGELKDLEASLGQMVFNLPKVLLEGNTRKADLVEVMDAVVVLSRNSTITRAHFDTLTALLAKKGIDIIDLLKCR